MFKENSPILNHLILKLNILQRDGEPFHICWGMSKMVVLSVTTSSVAIKPDGQLSVINDRFATET